MAIVADGQSVVLQYSRSLLGMVFNAHTATFWLHTCHWGYRVFKRRIADFLSILEGIMLYVGSDSDSAPNVKRV